jgi:hypothetical protein
MTNRSATMAKRQREQAQKEKAQIKEQRRAERRAAVVPNPNGASTDPDYDPDIAHIVPGPQPIPEDDNP